MRAACPFQADDLRSLDELLSKAHAVVSMREVHAGNRHYDCIGLRHDVDDNPGALEAAVKLARWEAERGYRSTYYLLHSAPYWTDGRLQPAAEAIALLGHEIGLHANGLAEAIRTKRDQHEILEDALATLRGFGLKVSGVVGHGDPLCPKFDFANDEQFVECARPNLGAPDREVGGVQIQPRTLASFGLDYESVRLERALYNTDSGGKWYAPWQETVAAFEATLQAGPAQVAGTRALGQLHLLVHPDWWTRAFD